MSAARCGTCGVDATPERADGGGPHVIRHTAACTEPLLAEIERLRAALGAIVNMHRHQYGSGSCRTCGETVPCTTAQVAAEPLIAALTTEEQE